MNGYARFVRRIRAKEFLRKGFLWFLGWFFGHVMTLEARGLENIPERGAYIIAANHNGHGDHGSIFFVLGKKRDKLKIVGARDHFFEGWRVILGIFWDAAIGAVPLERREGKEYAKRARVDFSFLKDLLAEGYSLLIYPEGGRKSRDDGWKLSAFKGGVSSLARKCEVAIIPCAVKGTEKFLTKTRGFTDFLRILAAPQLLEGTKIVVSFGEPILPCAEGKEKSSSEITKEVHKAVQGLLDTM